MKFAFGVYQLRHPTMRYSTAVYRLMRLRGLLEVNADYTYLMMEHFFQEYRV